MGLPFLFMPFLYCGTYEKYCLNSELSQVIMMTCDMLGHKLMLVISDITEWFRDY